MAQPDPLLRCDGPPEGGPFACGERDALLVGGDAATAARVAAALAPLGLRVDQVADLDAATRAVQRQPPALLVVDGALGADAAAAACVLGLCCQPARRLPLLLLHAGGELPIADAVNTDFLLQPFAEVELAIRARMLLRAAPRPRPALLDAAAAGDGNLSLGGLTIDLAAQRAMHGKLAIDLARQELRLLHYLMSHADRVHSRAHLVDRLWGRSADIDVRTIDVQVRRLRKALQPHALDALIQTVRGRGYRFSTLR